MSHGGLNLCPGPALAGGLSTDYWGTLLFPMTVSLLPWVMYILKGDPNGHSQTVGVDRQGHLKKERGPILNGEQT